MVILKLYGHAGNPGGIVNFQNSLASCREASEHQYKHFRTGKVHSSRFLSNPVIRLVDQLLSYLWFPFFLLITKPDVIEINSSLVPNAFRRDFIFARIARKLCPRARLVLFNHGWNDKCFYNFMENNNKKLIEWFSFFDEIIVLCSRFSDEIKKLNSQANTHVITTGIDLRDFSRLACGNETAGGVQLLFLSRVEKAKGIGDLLSALPIILEAHPETRLVVAGVGGALEEAKLAVRELGVEKNVLFTGYLRGNDKLDVMAKSHIYIFPSYGEGCPISVLEAMAAGLPIIYSPVGALPEILKDGVNGILISTGNPRAIAKAVEHLINDAVLRNQIRVNNLQLAKSFDLSIIQQKLEMIYTGHG